MFGVMHRILCCYLFITVLGCSRVPTPAPVAQQDIDKQRSATWWAVNEYKPHAAGNIEQLASPAVEILRQLPGVANVEVLVPVEKPTHRIIHLRDWHVVPPELASKLPSEKVEEIRRQSELVQLEQLALLRCLKKHHGLVFMLVEGLTEENIEGHVNNLAGVKEMRKRIDKLKAEQESLKKPSPEIDRELAELERSLSADLTAFGVWARSELGVAVLDDATLLDAAKPVIQNGETVFNAQAVAKREEAMVRIAMELGPVSFVLLGGDHDLSDAVRKVGGGAVEYLRVTTKRYQQVAGQ